MLKLSTIQKKKKKKRRRRRRRRGRRRRKRRSVIPDNYDLGGSLYVKRKDSQSQFTEKAKFPSERNFRT